MSEESRLLTVSQATHAIKRILEMGFSSLYVKGEISNCKKQSSGHYYFSLKDENASIACVLFRQDALKLSDPLKDGESITIKGSLTVYPQSGKYQIIVREVQRTGLGDLLLKLEQLKIKLHRKGWFKQERKKSLPKMPKRIGIVTSPTGAVIQDILKVLKRRFSGLHIFLNPVRVQGEGSAKEIAKAIREFNRLNFVDVLIVGRGGGSIEDLFAFNEECVAEAIFESHIPIICAVGHETDHCIAEYVADVRAPTPSAAAEMVIAEKVHYEKALKQIKDRLFDHVKLRVRRGREHLRHLLKQPKLKNPQLLLAAELQNLDGAKEAIDKTMLRFNKTKQIKLTAMKQRLSALNPYLRLLHAKERKKSLKRAIHISFLTFFKKRSAKLSELNEKLNKSIHFSILNHKVNSALFEKRKELDKAIDHLLRIKEKNLNHCGETLSAINPKKLLSKGFTILFSEKEGSVIKSVHALQKNESYRLLLSDGEAKIQIEKTKPFKKEIKN